MPSWRPLHLQLKKDDVFMNVRMCQALDNENEPTWKEVKTMKDILGGCSPNSPEGIELNLARATKSAGLKIDDLRAALTAQKTMHSLGVDPIQMAKIMNIQKVRKTSNHFNDIIYTLNALHYHLLNMAQVTI